MSYPPEAAPVRHFQSYFDEHVNDGLFVDLGDAFHLYMWMRANAYWSPQAESFGHVGYWIKRGLIVTRLSLTELGKKWGKSPKTISRWLDKIEDFGFGVRLQEGGFIRGDDGRAPTIVAFGAWQHGPDGARIPHYIGWTNALKGEGGHITVDELAGHLQQLGERSAQARKHLADASRKWAEIRATFLAEEELVKAGVRSGPLAAVGAGSDSVTLPGRTNLSNRGIATALDPGRTNLSSRGRTNLSSVNLDSSLPNRRDTSLRSVSAGDRIRQLISQKRNRTLPESQAGGVGVAVEKEAAAPPAEVPAAPTESPASPLEARRRPSTRKAPETAVPEAPRPKKPGKPRAKKEPKYPEGVFDAMKVALSEACYPEGGIPKSTWGLISTKTSELLDSGYAPGDVALIAERMRGDKFWRDKVTPGNLVAQAPAWKAAYKPAAPAPSAAPEAPVSAEMQAELDALNRESEARAAELRARGAR